MTFEQSISLKRDPATIREMTAVMDRLAKERDRWNERQAELAAQHNVVIVIRNQPRSVA
jgi:hypothetical protein